MMSNKNESLVLDFLGGYFPAFLLSTGALPPFFWTRALIPLISFLV
jgi:hypothetical protein